MSTGQRAGSVVGGAARPTECEEGCVTCGDALTRMRVLEADGARELALCVDDEQRRRSVETAIVGDVSPGEVLLVHAGTALFREGA
jgi:HupF/HypC family